VEGTQLSAGVLHLFQVQRVVPAFLSVVLLVAQFVCCQPSFVLPDGSKCAACPVLQHEDQKPDDELASQDHGDCHDCCTLEACQGENKLKNAAKSNERVPDSLLAVQPEPQCFQCLVPIVSQPRLAYEGLHPSATEPTSSRDRAPPFLSFS
jgi:hypothetical protein